MPENHQPPGVSLLRRGRTLIPCWREFRFVFKADSRCAIFAGLLLEKTIFKSALKRKKGFEGIGIPHDHGVVRPIALGFASN
jgi:hypothetical protein